MAVGLANMGGGFGWAVATWSPGVVSVQKPFQGLEAGRKLPESFQTLPESFQDVPESFQTLLESFQKLPESFQKLPEALIHSKTQCF